MPQPLSGLRVLELGTFVSAPYCGKLFAGYGAEVIKVEPPGGDLSRAHGPFKDGVPSPETSALFLYLNTGKKSVEFDVRTPAGRDAFLRLVEKSDVVIENFLPRDMRALGYFEVPTGTSKRPEVEDIPLQDFDKVLARMSVTNEPTGTLLAVRRIERRELHFLRCVMLFYKNHAQPPEVEVAFWREDGPAMEHEVRFQAVGGPDLVGARLLMAEAAQTPGVVLFDVPVAAASAAPPPAAAPVQPSQASAPTTPNAAAPKSVAPEVETMQTLLCHEHPSFLKKALLSAKRRLVIVSPWIRDSVIDWPFIASLEALLKSGVEVYIGYGIEKADGNGKRNAAQNKPDITPRAEADLRQLAERYRHFHFVHVGNTHRKSLVCDDQFAVVTSFNWLSYKGDSQGGPRDERGIVFRKKHHVERLAAEELELLGKGYAGASRAGAPFA